MSRSVLPVVLSAMLSLGSMPIAMAANDSNLNFKIYSPDANASAATAETPAESATGDAPMPKTDNENNGLLGAPIPEIKTTPAEAPSTSTSSDTTDSNIVDSVLKGGNERLKSETPTAAPTPTPTPAPALPTASGDTADEAKTDTASATPAMPAADAPAADTTAAATTGADETTAVNTEKTASAEGSKPLQGYIRVVPEGTKIPIIMDTAVDSETSQEGDEFSARTAEDLTIDGATVVPAGSIIKGRIAQLNPPKHLNRGGSVALKFDTVTTPDNRQIPLVANLVKRGGVVHARRGLQDIAFDTGTVALPMLLGLGIGYVAGNSNTNSTTTTSGSTTSNSKIGKGEAAAIGAAIGLAVGVAIICAKKGKKVDVRPGDELKIELAEDLRMPVM